MSNCHSPSKLFYSSFLLRSLFVCVVFFSLPARRDLFVDPDKHVLRFFGEIFLSFIFLRPIFLVNAFMGAAPALWKGPVMAAGAAFTIMWRQYIAKPAIAFLLYFLSLFSFSTFSSFFSFFFCCLSSHVFASVGSGFRYLPFCYLLLSFSLFFSLGGAKK